MLGRWEQALRIRQDVYSGSLKLYGEEHRETHIDASNYAATLCLLLRFEEAKSLLLKNLPVARHVFGESDRITLRMRTIYAEALYEDTGAALEELREAVNTIEDTVRIARHVFGSAHPTVKGFEEDLKRSQEALHARETPSPGGA